MKLTPLIIAVSCVVVATGCSTARQAPIATSQQSMERMMPLEPPTAATISRTFLGSGEQGKNGFENATKIENDVFHAPQYLPGFPTAATIWPRVIDVPCRDVGGKPQCDSYEWLPSYGRGEYLYFRGVPVAQVVVPDVVVREQPVMTPRKRPPELRKSIRE